MEIKEQIKNIENTINSLQEMLKTLKESQVECVKIQPIKRWRTETEDEEYWFVNSQLEIDTEPDQSHRLDNSRYKIGNYFQTKQEAQDYLDNILCKQELKDLALELNNGVEIDWEKGDQRKYFIIYDNCGKDFRIEFRYDNQDFGQVYCLYPNFLEIAKERIGENRLIKLIKSGV